MRDRQIRADLTESSIQNEGPLVEERTFLEPSSTSASVDREIASDDRVITLSLTPQDARQLIFSLHRVVHALYREPARAASWQRQKNPKPGTGRKP